ncbi:ABC transporter substrate-binding protein [Hyunsoonleella sp. SJ7]|uniref:ABC transporter substrate-binding protein n=1 Tax=Hyunsoonleella aquatilis TaxID=2762758 RepID=A0A923HG66_9FLAO|nr:helical backbone metal receptor [Hyunsoonleella aquatilis]MBC3758790.1 ABC transporter substrate-binding protein [Hyunsoonleella aquatilis]
MATALIDQIGRRLCLSETPKRIVSLVPSQTELLCDLGLEDNLVGVTKFCVHPKHIKSKAKVIGGTKQVNFEKIKTVKPDIILCNKEENTKAIVEVCGTICPVHVSDIFDLDDSLELVKQYGQLFIKEDEAKVLIDKIQGEASRFESFIENYKSLKTIYFIWKNPWMVAGGSTFIEYLMQLNRFENFYDSENRYPEIQLNIEEEVDLVLLSSEPFPFKEVNKKELQEFYPNAKILLVDGEYFSWYGSRLVKAFDYFKSLRSNL